MKKRSAPVPPKDDDSSGSNNSTLAKSHSRTASDSGTAFKPVPNQSHWRNFSTDLSSNDSIGYENKIHSNVKTNPQSVSVFVSDNKNTAQIYASVQRPRCAPPPAPDPNRISNGQSIESLPSISSESEDCANRSHLVPVPPPRKVWFYFLMNLMID